MSDETRFFLRNAYKDGDIHIPKETEVFPTIVEGNTYTIMTDIYSGIKVQEHDLYVLEDNCVIWTDKNGVTHQYGIIRMAADLEYADRELDDDLTVDLKPYLRSLANVQFRSVRENRSEEFIMEKLRSNGYAECCGFEHPYAYYKITDRGREKLKELRDND